MRRTMLVATLLATTTLMIAPSAMAATRSSGEWIGNVDGCLIHTKGEYIYTLSSGDEGWVFEVTTLGTGCEAQTAVCYGYGNVARGFISWGCDGGQDFQLGGLSLAAAAYPGYAGTASLQFNGLFDTAAAVYID